jgi:phosphomethylpyrimidine synthase
MSTTKQNGERRSGDVQLPNSRRVYAEGPDKTLRVPLREITLQPTRLPDGRLETNEPVRVYDTSGPWGDPSCAPRVTDGLPALRRAWILARGDVEEYEGREIVPQDDGYLTEGAAEFAKNKDRGRLEPFPGLKRSPLRARAGACVTQMHYARRGVVTPEMEFVALRENMGRA